MAFTVKQVAELSGVSVRTLHFYDEAGLLKPAYVGANGYRFYEEPQLLLLQQILFYRELGFELKQIKEIVGRGDFEKLAALASHRTVLQQEIVRRRRLIETIDRTIQHLQGVRPMSANEMFAGFSVPAGEDRFGEQTKIGGEPIDCKVSGKDTGGAMCIFEWTGGGGGPLHLHYDQDEWVYVVEGDFVCLVGEKRLTLGPGESVFIPRKVPHIWGSVSDDQGRVINVYQPAGKMEDFFRALSRARDLPTREQVLNNSYTEQQKQSLDELFEAHGMDLLGPPPLADLKSAAG